jgi:orotate phosphoribosyltransferase
MSQDMTAHKRFGSTAKERLARRVVETASFLSALEPTFPLASGVLSQYYIDCKVALSYADVRELLGELVVERMGSIAVDAVGGLALGAYPIALAVSDAFYRRHGQVVRAFVVRKEPKKHGLKKHIEGDVRAGDQVLIVDDVITTGCSTIDAIIKCREEGLRIVKAIAMIDRQECGGAQNIIEQGVDFESIITLQDLREMQELSAHAG